MELWRVEHRGLLTRNVMKIVSYVVNQVSSVCVLMWIKDVNVVFNVQCPNKILLWVLEYKSRGRLISDRKPVNPEQVAQAVRTQWLLYKQSPALQFIC